MKKFRFLTLGYHDFTEHDIEYLKTGSGALNYDDTGIWIPIGEVYITDEILCVDVTIPGGLTIRGNHYSKLPPEWDINKNDAAVEIVDSKQVPMYQVILRQPMLVEVNGAFLCGHGQMVATMGDGRRTIIRLDKQPGATPSPIPVLTKRIFKYPAWQHRGEYETDTVH